MSAALLLGRPEIRKRSQMRKLQRKKERLRRLQKKRAGSSCGACRLLSCAPRERESGGDNPFHCRRLC